VVTDLYGQVDVTYTVMDALGLQGADEVRSGRNMFAEYATTRPLPFANTYRGLTGLLASDGLLLCDEPLSDCSARGVRAGALFSPLPGSVPVDEQARMTLAAVRRHSDNVLATGSAATAVHTLAPPVVEAAADSSRFSSWLLFGQGIAAPAGTTIEVAIDVTYCPEVPRALTLVGRVADYHDYEDRERHYFSRFERPLEPGERLTFTLRAPNDRSRRQLEVWLGTDLRPGERATFLFHDARLSILPGTDGGEAMERIVATPGDCREPRRSR
jgi:hypothetical protein